MTDTLPSSDSPPSFPGAARALWVLKTGSTLDGLHATLGDFDDWIRQGLQAAPTGLPVQVIDGTQADRPDHAWPQRSAIAGVVVTGSHAMVSDRAAWSEACADWLRTLVAAQVPVLGICFGHQLLAHALGGDVGPHPQGLELGTVEVTPLPGAREDALLQALPPTFAANAVHYQSVLTLPPGAVPLACNAHDPHHAFRVGPCAWGVQFHPEFATEAMQGYVAHLAPGLRPNEPAARARVAPTPDAAALLPRFARIAGAPRP